MATGIELYDEDRLQSMESIVQLHHHGHNATQIARQLNLPRKEVLHLINKYKEAGINDLETRDVAKEMLHRMIAHYDELIKKSHELLEDLGAMMLTPAIAGQMNSVLKNLADFEAKRVDVLQKAGILDAHELGDELAKMEEAKEVLLGILRNDLCDQCRPKIMRKIGEISGRAEVITYES